MLITHQTSPLNIIAHRQSTTMQVL